MRITGHDIPDEILRAILDEVRGDSDRSPRLDSREFLSVESFHISPPLPPMSHVTNGIQRTWVENIGAFRCASRRFADLGAPFFFGKVVLRFSERDFQKLEQLASWPHLAKHATDFTYFVPYFYRYAKRRLPPAANMPQTLDWSEFLRKAEEQQRLIQSQRDVKALNAAMASFTGLQSVKLLRLFYKADGPFLAYIQRHAEIRQVIDMEWASACTHVSETIGKALLVSNNQWSRFSSPALSPQGVGFLAFHQPLSSSTLAERLTCLALHFDDCGDLEERMNDLSGHFLAIFTAAKAMQSVHVGFPGHRPLDLPLESVFHNITWEKLTAFGVQGWRLDADEIKNLTFRHRDRLKGLRLRDVLLKNGSMWADVLSTLRKDMHALQWLSLRRIGYTAHFRDPHPSEHEILSEDGDDSDEEEEEEEDDEEEDDEEEGDGFDGPVGSSNGSPDSFSEDSDDSHSDSEHGFISNGMEFPTFVSPDAVLPLKHIRGGLAGSSDITRELDDNGLPISNAKRKAWERWVIDS